MVASTPAWLRGAVDSLSALDRRAVELVYVDGRSCQQAADRLDLPVSAVSQAVMRAFRVIAEAAARWADAGAISGEATRRSRPGGSQEG